MRYILRVKQQKNGTSPAYTACVESICLIEERLAVWKTQLRKEKKKTAAHQLEKQSNTLAGIEILSEFIKSPQLEPEFSGVVTAAGEGEESAPRRLEAGNGCSVHPRTADFVEAFWCSHAPHPSLTLRQPHDAWHSQCSCRGRVQHAQPCCSLHTHLTS